MSKRPKQSAGLLMYRHAPIGLEVFLVHSGGPYFAKQNEGAWTIPKGEYVAGEEPLAAAQREFHEETGFTAEEPFAELGSIRQKSGKTVLAWAFEGDCDPDLLISNTCEIEWPPRSKKKIEYRKSIVANGSRCKLPLTQSVRNSGRYYCDLDKRSAEATSHCCRDTNSLCDSGERSKQAATAHGQCLGELADVFEGNVYVRHARIVPNVVPIVLRKILRQLLGGGHPAECMLTDTRCIRDKKHSNSQAKSVG